MGVRDRVLNATHGVLSRVLRDANASLDVPALRRRFRAPGGRVAEVRVGGTKYRNWLQVTDDGLHFVPMPKAVNRHGDKAWNGDGLLEFRDYPTLIDLIRGKISRRDPRTGETYWAPFDPQTAFFFGYIRAYGDSATNEALRFILGVWPQIRERLARDFGIA